MGGPQTPKEVVIRCRVPWWNGEYTAYSSFFFSREPDQIPASSFLVIQTALDRPLQTSPGTVMMPNNVHSAPSPSTPGPGLGGQTGRGATVVSDRRWYFFFLYIYFNIFYLFLLNEIFTHPLHDRHRLLGNREVLTLPNLRKWIVKNCRRKELKSERMNNLNKMVSF